MLVLFIQICKSVTFLALTETSNDFTVLYLQERCIKHVLGTFKIILYKNNTYLSTKCDIDYLIYLNPSLFHVFLIVRTKMN